MAVPYIPFVEAILESFEFKSPNFFIDVLKGFLASFKDAG